MSVTVEIYKGIRGDKFIYFLKQLLSLSNLDPKYHDVILDKEGLQLYNTVFTHPTADPIDNYEYLEFLGDSTLNKSIAWYLPRRFPQLQCGDGVKVLARLKINLISKHTFATLAKRFHFWEFISMNSDVKDNNMNKTLEDVFEAFFGATEYIIDTKFRIGVGYSICYDIISNILDTHPISLKYVDLFDAKTRLKEIFDHFKTNLGVLVYKTEKVDRINYTKIYRKVYKEEQWIKNPYASDENQKNVLVIESDTQPGKYKDVLAGRRLKLKVQPQTIIVRSVPEEYFIGEGSAALKIDSEQKAAKQAIERLKNDGFEKPLSNGYRKFCE